MLYRDFTFSFYLACLAIVSIENGRVHGNDVSVGSRYWFTCNKGFTLIGADFIECGEDGQWNGELPKCTKGKIE